MFQYSQSFHHKVGELHGGVPALEPLLPSMAQASTLNP
jgi:hypothetical protein